MIPGPGKQVRTCPGGLGEGDAQRARARQGRRRGPPVRHLVSERLGQRRGDTAVAFTVGVQSIGVPQRRVARCRRRREVDDDGAVAFTTLQGDRVQELQPPAQDDRKRRDARHVGHREREDPSARRGQLGVHCAQVFTQRVAVELRAQYVVDTGHHHGEVRRQIQCGPQLRLANLVRSLSPHREVGVEQARMHHVQVTGEAISPPDVDPVGAGILNALNSAVTDRNQAKGHSGTPHDRNRGLTTYRAHLPASTNSLAASCSLTWDLTEYDCNSESARDTSNPYRYLITPWAMLTRLWVAIAVSKPAYQGAQTQLA